jgi:hypothetical protein
MSDRSLEFDMIDQLQRECIRLQLEIEQFILERDQLILERDRLVLERDQARAQLRSIESSRSWRLTAPIRALTSALRRKGVSSH